MEEPNPATLASQRQRTYAAEVRVVRVNVWEPTPRNFRVLGPWSEGTGLSTEDEEVLQAARRGGRPVWVELKLSEGWPDWYGSWKEFDRPTVSWADAEPLLGLLGLESPEASEPREGALGAEILRVLPFIYELGASRAFGEIRADHKLHRARSFPAAGFEVVGEGLRPVCLNVASVDDFVFTMRQRRPGDQETVLPLSLKSALGGPPPLQVPLRYLPPSGHEVTANHVVDGIALYLGATCEWVVENVHDSLTEVEDGFFKEIRKHRPTELAREDAAAGLLAGFKELQELGDVMRKVGRELALILQRAPAGAKGVGDKEATARVEQRYQNALSKVDALQMQLRSAGETMASALTTQQFVIAEKHRRLDEDRRTESEHLQRGGTVLAALILVPTLMAGIYGANVPVPGEKEWQGVMAMLLFMLSGGLVTWAAITRFGDRARERTASADAERTPQPWYKNKGLCRASGAAAASFVLGLVFVALLLGDPGQSTFEAEHLLTLLVSVLAVAVVGGAAGLDRFEAGLRKLTWHRYTWRQMKGTHIARRS